MASGNGRRLLLGVLTAAVMAGAGLADAAVDALPKLGPAADFVLIDQHGQSLSMRQLRGKVVVLTFIYASCTDACPTLIAKLVRLQHRLDGASGRSGGRARFVAVTVDPGHDTPAVLAEYAARYGAASPGWSFLSGSEAAVRQLATSYGVAVVAAGELEHSFLTSLIDAGGTLRVQYLGTRFKPDEMLADLHALLAERR